MKITAVDVIAVKGRHWPRFPMVFVEVHTDQGLTGLGEALPYQATGLIGSLREMGKALEGADPLRVEYHWERFFRGGANLSALSALETAMWDIVGKAAGMWIAAGLIVAAFAVMVWRKRPLWQPGTVRVMRRAGRTLRQFGSV